MLRSFIFGSSLALGVASAAIHRSWTLWEDELDHQEFTSSDPKNGIKNEQLGGTGMTLYNFSGTTNEKSAVRSPLACNVPASKLTYDVCVIGGGFAGLHTALALAEKGKKVVLLEGKRIGCGASGRNGGDALIGFHCEVEELSEYMGSVDKAKQLFSHSEAGYNRLKDVIAKYKIQCDAKEHGAITMSFAADKKSDQSNSGSKAIEETEEFNKKFNQKVEFRDKKAVAKMGFHSDRYSHGYFEPRNITLNPLELCFGLARACETNGVQIFEQSKVLAVHRDLRGNFVTSTSMGTVTSKHCVLATNHAPWHLSKSLALRTTSLATSMMLTAPIDKSKLDRCITCSSAVFDERFGLAYFRRVAGDRLVYGCFASGMPYFTSSESAAAKKGKDALTDDLLKTFSSVLTKDDIRVDRFWSGRLQCQYPVFPLVGRDSSSGMYYSLGFAGHGVVPTCAAGIVLANAICDGDTQYELWDEVVPKWSRLQGGPTGYLGATAASVLLRYYDKIQGRF